MVLLAGLLIVYWIGAIACLLAVFPARIGASIGFGAYATAIGHGPSRRNGVPWMIKTYVKSMLWPIVLGLWMSHGKPGPRELYGDAAAERLGLALGDAFATKWAAS